MNEKDMKKIIEEARILISSLFVNEDLEFRKALVLGKFEKKEHKEKYQGMLDLIKRMENLNTLNDK